jgi:hypothetical protein
MSDILPFCVSPKPTEPVLLRAPDGSWWVWNWSKRKWDRATVEPTP